MATLNEEMFARAAGMALQLGERVEVNNGPFGNWGEGTIVDKSTTDYGGSKLFPVFEIQRDDGLTGWFSAISIFRIKS
jgi:hypothetical protein